MRENPANTPEASDRPADPFVSNPDARSRRGPVVVGILGMILVGVLALWWANERRAERELARLRELCETGRPIEAIAGLRALVKARPSGGEARLLLGVAEEAAGHNAEALAAWASVPPGSPSAPRAAMLRGELAMRLGRFSEAEAAFHEARKYPSVAGEANPRITRLLRLELRLADLRRHLHSLGGRADRAEALRDLVQLDFEPIPVQGVGALLKDVSATACDDDRYWLAQANLARMTGRLVEARRWLDRCEKNRPGDRAVARARLDWAFDADRPTEVLRALRSLTDDEIEPEERLTLDAWFARHASDPEAERLALSTLLERDPGDISAIERLTVLAAREGDDRQVAQLQARKDALNRERNAYHIAITPPDYASRPGELARLADALGRRFEAAGWAALALHDHPGDPEFQAILDRNRSAVPPAPTLPELRARWTDVVESTRDHSPGLDARRAGARVAFSDDARRAGLRFAYDNGETPEAQLPEAMGGGLGLLDFDGDGWLDLYVVQGGTFPPPPEPPPGGDRLFRNRGDGTFEDVTEAAGLDQARGYGHGVTVGDIDNDGRPDLFVTRWRSYALYRNRGDGTFEDVTEAWGLGGDRDWPTSAAFADLDGDGDLDLYVCHYLVWKTDPPKLCPHPHHDGYTVCPPNALPALPDHVFRNEGGRFVDATEGSGIIDPDGRGLGVVAADLDDDGRVDLFVANDTTANLYFRNLGDWRFAESARAAGVAANAQGGYQAGMGVALGDVNGDALPDLAVTNFFGESTSLFASLAPGLYADQTAAAGLAVATRYVLGFGVVLDDFDNDGRLDLLTANGHVSDLTPVFPHAMPVQLLLGTEQGRFLPYRPAPGSPLAVPRVARGLAAGDLDNDGRLDALVVDHLGPLAYLHNRSQIGRSLTLALVGTTSNRDAVGARVTIEADGRRQTAWRFGGGSYLAASDPRLHFGLGDAGAAQTVEVRWPSGRVDRHADLPAGTGWRLVEGDPTPQPLPGFRTP